MQCDPFFILSDRGIALSAELGKNPSKHSKISYVHCYNGMNV